MRTVLMIVPAWPPVNSIAVRRPVRLVRRLPKLGWSPVVLTPDPPGAYELEPTPLDPQIDVPDVDVARVPSSFWGVRARRRMSDVLAGLGQERLDHVAQIGINRFLRPDHLPEWTVAAVRSALEIAARRTVDIVWVTTPPFGSLLVGAVVARVLRRPLVLDYRDPWTQAPESSPRRLPWLGMPRRSLELAEGAVLRQARGVSFITQHWLDRHEARFGRGADACWRAIPNGFDREDLPDSGAERFDHPTVLYAGSCYRSRRLQPILEAMVAEVRSKRVPPNLLFHGELDPPSRVYLDDHQAELAPYVSARPRIPMGELASKMRGASALLLLTGEEHKHAVAAKVFDYFLAERPILGYGPEGSAVAEIIKATGTGEWVSHEDGAEALQGALRQIAGEGLRYDPSPDAISQHSADAMAERTVALLDASVG